MSTTITTTFELDSDDFLCICEMAGYSIGYWAIWAKLDADESEYTIFYLEDEADADTKKKLMISKDMLEQTIADLYSGKYPEIRNESIIQCCCQLVHGEGAEDVDSTAADVLIQLAGFGEVVYG